MRIVYVLFFVIQSAVAQEFVVNQQEVDQSITKADGYLSSNLNSHFLMLVLHNLNQKKILKSSFPIDSLLKSPLIYDDEKQNMPYLLRWGVEKPKIKISSIKKIVNPIDKMLIAALYSDRVKITKDVIKNIRTYSDSNANARYGAHVAIALYWIDELGQSKQIPNIQELKKSITIQLKSSIDTSDTGMEAVFGLILLDQKNSIPTNYLQSLIAAQKSDGGWSWAEREHQNQSHQHPTTLAVTIISMLTHPEIKKFRCIIR